MMPFTIIDLLDEIRKSWRRWLQTLQRLKKIWGEKPELVRGWLSVFGWINPTQ
jgi:hypothetical protein